MKINGKVIKTTYLTRYAKSKLGYAGKDGVKLNEIVCMALELDGMPMPMNMTCTQWVKANIDHIVGQNIFKKLESCTKQALAYKPKLKKQKASKVKTVTGVNVISNDFLQTYEWRKLRMEALKKYGAKCQCCGATPVNGAVMNVDHIKPRKLFPHLALDISNLQILCHECNHGKGNWDQTDWRPG